ncbi:MAG: hypothetical protein JWM32_1245 [Verrucomicrobia bacterium]|nr:hypothetical protein [Verrucomicrobiota bacterium]
MFSTVLPVWGVALLLSACCWSIGSWLVAGKNPVVAMAAGWCVFLLLCTVTWAGGISANTARPLFWLFFALGLVLAFKHLRGPQLPVAILCTAGVTVLLAAPFLRFPGLLAYGVHGVDLWGYVITADWLQDHSFRQLPEIGISPMRFNWTWHVLDIRDRPLTYEALACLAASTGLSITEAYLAFPIVVLSSLVMALGLQPEIFRVKYWALALVPAFVLLFHPLIVLPWIAGFFGGSITGLFTALALGVAAMPGDKPTRNEAIAIATLLLVLCAGLYTVKFIYVALAVGGVPVLLRLAMLALRHDFSPLLKARPSPRITAIVAVTVLAAVLFVVLGRDQKVDTGQPQLPAAAVKHALGVFGGTSPYVWLGYDAGNAFTRLPWSDPLGWACAGIFTALIALVAWRRWRAHFDLMLPLLVGLIACIVARSIDDELIMGKTLTIVGPALLVILAVSSPDLKPRWLGWLAALLCCLPAFRAEREMRDVIWDPVITVTDENLPDYLDGQDWRVLGYLHFLEDRNGFDWSKNPRMYFAVTQFLPDEQRAKVDRKYRPGAEKQ